MADTPRKKQIEQLITEDPSDVLLRYMLAMEYVSQGDDRGALERFEELFAVDRGYVPAYMQSGQALARLSRVQEARNRFQEGIVVARKKQDLHALGEMEGMLQALE